MKKTKKHDHRQSMWLICGGWISWCYQCGAWQQNRVEEPNVSIRIGKWNRPTGIGGENPAMKKYE